MEEKFFTSTQATAITGCSRRQLQYWRDQNIVVPTVHPIGKGRNVFYSREDLATLMVMSHLLSKGLDFEQACRGLKLLKQVNSKFTQPKSQDCYFLTFDDSGHQLVIKNYDADTMGSALQKGEPIIPILLGDIHRKLLEKLSISILPKKSFYDKNLNLLVIQPEQFLESAGWQIVSNDNLCPLESLSNHAVKNYSLVSGVTVDYALFVNGLLLGVVNTKDDFGKNYREVFERLKKCSRFAMRATGMWQGCAVPFLYTWTKSDTLFWDVREKINVPYSLMNFHPPKVLFYLLGKNSQFSDKWFSENPINSKQDLDLHQIKAIENIESAIQFGQRSLSVVMPAGLGRSWIICNLIYRLLSSQKSKKILVLCDHSQLVNSLLSKLYQFNTSENKYLSEIYKIYQSSWQFQSGNKPHSVAPEIPHQFFLNPPLDDAYICVLTLENLVNTLNSQGEEDHPSTLQRLPIPIHGFDTLIVPDIPYCRDFKEEQELNYLINHFDTIKIGFTHFPGRLSQSLFSQLVYRYPLQQAIVDGQFVDCEQINIDGEIAISTTFDELIKTKRNRQNLIKNNQLPYADYDAIAEWDTSEIEHQLLDSSNCRRVLKEISQYAKTHEEKTGHFPKILIIACQDGSNFSQADQLVQLSQEIFAGDNKFVQKITSNIDYPFEKINLFESEPLPAIVVTTPEFGINFQGAVIEFLVFMAPIKSPALWIQLLASCLRCCPSLNKTHVKIFDCFNGSLINFFNDSVEFSIESPRWQSMPLSQIIQNLANQIEPDFHLSMLMRRLYRIDRSVTLEGKNQLEEYLPGVSGDGLAIAWLNLFQSSQDKALALLEMPNFQVFLDDYPRLTSSLQNLSAISHSIPDHFLIGGKKPKIYLEKFCEVIFDNRLEVEKLFQFSHLQVSSNDLNVSDSLDFALISSEQRWGILRLLQLRQMLNHFNFAESDIQKAFQFVHGRADIDLISLTKWALDQSSSVYTASERIDLAIASVIEKFNLNEEQSRFLGLLREYLIQNLCIELTDLEQVSFLKQQGLLFRARNLFNLSLGLFIGYINVAIAMVE